MRNAASISASSCSRSVPSMLARNSASVSNSLADRASSSSSSAENLLLHLRTVTFDGRARPVGEGNAICFVSPADAPTSAASSSVESRPPPSSRTVSRLGLAVGVEEIDEERVARLRGTIARGRELCDGLAQRLDLGVHRVLRNLDLGTRDFERRPVDELGERLHLDGRDEAPRFVGRVGKLELVGRVARPGARDSVSPRSRTNRRCGCRPPPRRSAPCRVGRRAPASGSSPCGSRGS